MTFHTLGLMKNLVARSAEEHESRERIETEMDLVQKSDQIICQVKPMRSIFQYLYDGNSGKNCCFDPWG